MVVIASIVVVLASGTVSVVLDVLVTTSDALVLDIGEAAAVETRSGTVVLALVLDKAEFETV